MNKSTDLAPEALALSLNVDALDRSRHARRQPKASDD
jgi:hypothetical protein